MARGKKDQPEKEHVWSVLKRIAPRLIKSLMRYANTRSQAAFAAKTGMTANQINRYYNGKEFPEENLAYVTAELKLTEDNTWWLLGDELVKEYQYAKFEIPPPGNEVREPHTPYGVAERDPPVEIAMIMALDLSRLGPAERVQFARQRNALRDQAVAHRELVDDFVERYTAARRRRRRS